MIPILIKVIRLTQPILERNNSQLFALLLSAKFAFDIKANEDKLFRETYLKNTEKSLLDLTRLTVLADNGIGAYTDYFTRYRELYSEKM